MDLKEKKRDPYLVKYTKSKTLCESMGSFFGIFQIERYFAKVEEKT